MEVSVCRYLRASKWVLHTAIERLEDTLKWRREYGFYDGTLSEGLVEPEVCSIETYESNVH